MTAADFEGIRYRWRCPRCDVVVEEEDDPRGTVVECDCCPWTGEVAGSP